MGQIIDDVNKLMDLSADELTEALLKPTYNNKANLRELVRRSLYSAETYKKAYENEKEKVEELPKEFIKNTLSVISRELEMDKDELINFIKEEM